MTAEVAIPPTIEINNNPERDVDDLVLETVEIESDEDEEDGEEDLERAQRKLKKMQKIPSKSANEAQEAFKIPEASMERVPEVLDDFVRNYLLKLGLNKALDTFETEWYQMLQEGKLPAEVGKAPNIYVVNQDLDNQLQEHKRIIERMKSSHNKLQDIIDKLNKERDFHRMHHKRVGQEKNKLVEEVKQLKSKLDTITPRIGELEKQVEQNRREKVAAQMERDKAVRRITELENFVQEAQSALKSSPNSEKVKSVGAKNLISPKRSKPKDFLPTENRPNPWFDHSAPPPSNIDHWKSISILQGHEKPISSIALHPSKNALVTASDDATWKLWDLQDGSVIMRSSSGHKDWIADCDFHPSGLVLATASGDHTVKIWDFKKGECSLTFVDHNQPVWGCAFHDSGDFVISASMDKTCKLFDIAAQKCRQTLRGHTDSVNHVVFQPYTNHAVSCSGDKSVSMWDVRTALCLQTFFGHKGSCNHVVFNRKGDTIASTDTTGVVKIWDVRMVTERLSLDAGPFPATRGIFDNSGRYFIVGTDEAVIKIFDIEQKKLVKELSGHKGPVHSVSLDLNGQTLLSAGKDGMIRVWS